ALAALEERQVAPELVARHFELHILGAVGFRPELSVCLSCGAEIQPGANGYSVLRGGIFCPSCTAREPSTVPIAVDTLKLLRYLQRTPRPQDVTLRLPSAVARDAERL